jgi:hypothetical protein
MQAQSTTAPILRGTWVSAHGERKCARCGATIPTHESHLAYGARFELHYCNGCTGQPKEVAA